MPLHSFFNDSSFCYVHLKLANTVRYGGFSMKTANNIVKYENEMELFYFNQ